MKVDDIFSNKKMVRANSTNINRQRGDNFSLWFAFIFRAKWAL